MLHDLPQPLHFERRAVVGPGPAVPLAEQAGKKRSRDATPFRRCGPGSFTLLTHEFFENRIGDDDDHYTFKQAINCKSYAFPTYFFHGDSPPEVDWRAREGEQISKLIHTLIRNFKVISSQTNHYKYLKILLNLHKGFQLIKRHLKVQLRNK